MGQVAVYYKEHIKPLLEQLTTNVGGLPSSGDSDDIYEYVENRTRSRIVEAYPPKKMTQPIPVADTKVARSCTRK